MVLMLLRGHDGAMVKPVLMVHPVGVARLASKWRVDCNGGSVLMAVQRLVVLHIVPTYGMLQLFSAIVGAPILSLVAALHTFTYRHQQRQGR